MVAFALFMLTDVYSGANLYGLNLHELALSLFLILPAAFIVTGGVFCLQRKYWKVCFASSLVTVVIMITWWISQADSMLAWVVSMVGTFPIIFVLLTKKEWQVIQG